MVELLIVLLRELLLEWLRILGKELRVLSPQDSVDADVERL